MPVDRVLPQSPIAQTVVELHHSHIPQVQRVRLSESTGSQKCLSYVRCELIKGFSIDSQQEDGEEAGGVEELAAFGACSLVALGDRESVELGATA